MKFFLLGFLGLATLAAFIYESTEYVGYQKYSFKDGKLHIFPRARVLKESSLTERAQKLKQGILQREWQSLLDKELLLRFPDLNTRQKEWLINQSLNSELDDKPWSSEVKSWIEKNRQSLFSKFGVK